MSRTLCIDRASLVPKMVTESAFNAGDLGSIPESGSPGEGNDYPLQYSCLQNSTDRGAWQATVHGSQKSQNYLNWEKCTESQKIKIISIFAFNIRQLKMFWFKETSVFPSNSCSLEKHIHCVLLLRMFRLNNL